VVGGQPDDVHIGHIAHPQPRGENNSAGVAIETRVGGGVLALDEYRLHLVGVQRRVELGSGRASDAVNGPGVHIVR
jgi:hypothetical protein